MKTLITLLIFMVTSAVHAADIKPTLFTSPPDYLAQFPLDQVSETDMLDHVGPPARVVDLAGRKMLVYELGRGYGLRTFTYSIQDGKVVDVLYNDQGPYNGSSARKSQNR